MNFTIRWNDLDESKKIQLYTDYRVPPFRPEAVFSDGTNRYRLPAEPGEFQKVALRCRTALGNVDRADLVVDGVRYPMSVIKQDDLFEYYEVSITLEDKRVSYHFELFSGAYHVFYNRKGVSAEWIERGDFVIIPGFKTPEWAKGAVMYQIYTDRFYNGDPGNDVIDNEYIYIDSKVKRVTEWERLPQAMDVRNFYGGDIQGIIDKLDYLSELGVEVLYLNPIFVSPSNHKYDSQDYDYVDPHYGKIVYDEGEPLADNQWENSCATKYKSRVTNIKNLEASNELFATFTKIAHEKGMRVILDGVFNHCGSFNKWIDRERVYEGNENYEKGAFLSKKSPYNNFFKFNKDSWPYNVDYDGWWGHDTLPKLNYEESPELFRYIIDIARKWVSEPYNVDGWRLDVAADLGQSEEYNHFFWNSFRRAVKESNPEAVIIAEHYGDPSPWLQGDQWDTIMNYDAFMEPLSWFLTGMEKHSDEYRSDLIGNAEIFFESMRENMLKLTTPSLYISMNQLSNHDHSRFLTRTNHRVGRTATVGAESANYGVKPALMRAAVAVQMTWPGAPTLYYGDEVGLCGWTDPDNRRTFPWGHEDLMMLSFHKELIRIHKDYDSLRTGSFIELFAGQGVIVYGRFMEDEFFIIVINSGEIYKEIQIPVWIMGMLDNQRVVTMIQSTESSFSLHATMKVVHDGHIMVEVTPYSSALYKSIKL